MGKRNEKDKSNAREKVTHFHFRFEFQDGNWTADDRLVFDFVTFL